MFLWWSGRPSLLLFGPKRDVKDAALTLIVAVLKFVKVLLMRLALNLLILAKLQVKVLCLHEGF